MPAPCELNFPPLKAERESLKDAFEERVRRIVYIEVFVDQIKEFTAKQEVTVFFFFRGLSGRFWWFVCKAWADPPVYRA